MGVTQGCACRYAFAWILLELSGVLVGVDGNAKQRFQMIVFVRALSLFCAGTLSGFQLPSTGAGLVWEPDAGHCVRRQLPPA